MIIIIIVGTDLIHIIRGDFRRNSSKSAQNHHQEPTNHSPEGVRMQKVSKRKSGDLIGHKHDRLQLDSSIMNDVNIWWQYLSDRNND